MTIHTFKSILKSQTSLFQQLAEHQAQLQYAVMDKNYSLTDQSISAMRKISESIRVYEIKRQEAFEKLLESMDISVEYGLTMLFATLEPHEREELSSAFRELKIAVLQVRTVNEGIMAYSGSHMETMEEIIDALYPGRRDGTYNSSGARQKTATPLVLDHSL